MSRRRIRDLSVDSLVYGAGSIATKVVGFLLIPLYTRYLTPADYGLLALVTMWGTLAAILIGLGQHNAFFRFYFKQDDDAGRARVVSTFLAIVVVMGIPILAAVLASRPLSRLLLSDALYALPLVLMFAVSYLDLVNKVPLVIIRARRWAVRYSIYTVSKTLVTIGLTLLFVVSFRWGVPGVLGAQVISGALFTLALYALVMRGVRVRFDRAIGRDLLRFGLPLVPGFLLLFVFRFANRYFLERLSGMEEVGLFALGNRLGEIILFLNTAIQTAWPVFLYGSERDENARPLYARAMTYYVGVAGFGATALVVLTPEIFAVMVHETYARAQVVIPFAVVAYIFMGIHLFGNVGINLKERTSLYAGVSAVSAVAAVVLNLVLIPRWGIVGAASATTVAYAVQASLILIISRRLYPVGYELRRLLTLVVVYVAAAVVGRLVGPQGDLVALAVKGALLCAGVPAALALAGFFNSEERAKIRLLASAIVPSRAS